MFFSVVIPLYNKSYSIKKCVGTVINQIHKNFEIIIVNDGSTDDSLFIIKNSYKSEITCGLIKIIDQTNQGVSVARNNGIKVSKSNYICLLDADDEWKPGFLENINSLIESFPSAALYCLQHEINLDNKIIINKSSYSEGYFGLVDNFFKRSLFGSLANSSKVCIRKDIFEEIGGFPEGQKSGEDLIVWMKIALNYPVAIYNKVSARVNVISDFSRNGRNVSVPYPFLYYSESNHKKKLSFWSKLYLYKIFIMHLGDSIINLNYEGFSYRLEACKKLFPITFFTLRWLKLPIKAISRNE